MIKYEVKKVGGEWCASFTIGERTFRLAPASNKTEAQFLLKMLKIAFDNLTKETK